MVQSVQQQLRKSADVPRYRLTPPGNKEWREARWPVPMPGDDVPLTALAWCLLLAPRSPPRAHPELVTASELVAALDAVRRDGSPDQGHEYGYHRPREWGITRGRMQRALAELVRHGYVVAADREVRHG